MDWPRLLLLSYAVILTTEIRPRTLIASSIKTNSTLIANYGIMGTTDEEDSEKWGREQDRLYKELEAKGIQTQNLEESGSGSGDGNVIIPGNKRQMGNGNNTAENIISEAVNHAIQESKTTSPPMPATLGKTTYPTQPVTFLPNIVWPKLQQSTEVNTIVVNGNESGSTNVASTKVNVTGVVGQNLLVETTQTGAKEDTNKQSNVNMSQPSPGNPSSLNIAGKGSNVNVVDTTNSPPANNAPQSNNLPGQQLQMTASPTNTQPVMPTQATTNTQGGQPQPQTQAAPLTAVPSPSQQKPQPTQATTSIQVVQTDPQPQIQENDPRNASIAMPTQAESQTFPTQPATNGKGTPALISTIPTASVSLQSAPNNPDQISVITQAQPAQVYNTGYPAQLCTTPSTNQVNPNLCPQTNLPPTETTATVKNASTTNRPITIRSTISKVTTTVAPRLPSNVNPGLNPQPPISVVQQKPAPADAMKPFTNGKPNSFEISFHTHVHNPSKSKSTVQIRPLHIGRTVTQSKNGGLIITSSSIYEVGHGFPLSDIDLKPLRSGEVPQSKTSQKMPVTTPASDPVSNTKLTTTVMELVNQPGNPLAIAQKPPSTPQPPPPTPTKNMPISPEAAQKALPSAQTPPAIPASQTNSHKTTNSPPPPPSQPSLLETENNPTLPPTPPATLSPIPPTTSSSKPPPTPPSNWLPTYSLMKSVHRNTNTDQNTEPEMNISEMLFPKLPSSLPIMIMEDHMTPDQVQQPFLASPIQAPNPVPLMDKGIYQEQKSQAVAYPTASTSMFSQGSYPTTMVENPSPGMNLSVSMNKPFQEDKDIMLKTEKAPIENCTPQIEEISTSPLLENCKNTRLNNGVEISSSNEVLFDKKDVQTTTKHSHTNNVLPTSNPVSAKLSNETKNDEVKVDAFKGIEDAVLSVDISELRPGEILSLHLPNSESSTLFKVREIKSSDKVSQYTTDHDNDSMLPLNADKKHLLYAIIEKVKNNKEYRDAMKTIFTAADRRSRSKQEKAEKFPDNAMIKNYNAEEIERKAEEKFSTFLQGHMGSTKVNAKEYLSDTEGSTRDENSEENAKKKSAVAVKPISYLKSPEIHRDRHFKIVEELETVKFLKKQRKQTTKSAHKSSSKGKLKGDFTTSVIKQEKYGNDIKIATLLKKTASSGVKPRKAHKHVIIEDVQGNILYRGPIDITTITNVVNIDKRKALQPQKGIARRNRRSAVDGNDNADAAKKSDGTLYLTFKVEDKPKETVEIAKKQSAKEIDESHRQASVQTYSVSLLGKASNSENSETKEGKETSQGKKQLKREKEDKSEEKVISENGNADKKEKKKERVNERKSDKGKEGRNDEQSKNRESEISSKGLSTSTRKQTEILTPVQIEDDEGNVLYKGPVDIEALNDTISKQNGSYSGFHLEKEGYIYQLSDPQAMQVINTGLQNASPKIPTAAVNATLNRPRRNSQNAMTKASKKWEETESLDVDDTMEVKKSKEARLHYKENPNTDSLTSAIATQQEEKNNLQTIMELNDQSQNSNQLPSHVIIEDERGNSLYQGPVDIYAMNKSVSSKKGQNNFELLEKDYQLLKDTNKKLSASQNYAKGHSGPKNVEMSQLGRTATKGKTITIQNLHTAHDGQKVSVNVESNEESQDKTNHQINKAEGEEKHTESLKSPPGQPFFDAKNSKLLYRYVQDYKKTSKSKSSRASSEDKNNDEPSTQSLLDTIMQQVQNRKKEHFNDMFAKVKKGESSDGGRIAQGVGKPHSGNDAVDKATQSEYVKNVMQSWLKSKHVGSLQDESSKVQDEKTNKSSKVHNMMKSWLKNKKIGFKSNMEKGQQSDENQINGNQVMIQNEPSESSLQENITDQEDKTGYAIQTVKESKENGNASQENSPDEIDASVTGDNNIELQTNMPNGRVVLTTSKQPKRNYPEIMSHDGIGSQEPSPIAMISNSNQMVLPNEQNGNQLHSVLSSAGEELKSTDILSKPISSLNDAIMQTLKNTKQLSNGNETLGSKGSLVEQQYVKNGQNMGSPVTISGNSIGKPVFRIVKLSREKLNELLKSSQDSRQQFAPNQKPQNSVDGEPVALILSTPFLDETAKQGSYAKNSDTLQSVIGDSIPGYGQKQLLSQDRPGIQQPANLQIQQDFIDKNSNSTVTDQDKNALLLPNQYYAGDDEKILIGNGGKAMRPEPSAIGAFKSQESATDLNVLLKVPGSTSPSFLIQSKNMSPLTISSSSAKDQDASEISVLSGTGQKIECHTLPGQSSLTLLQCGSKAQQQAADISSLPAAQFSSNLLNLHQNDDPEQQVPHPQSNEMNFLPSYMLPTNINVNGDMSQGKHNNVSKIYGFGTATDPSIYRKATKEIKTYLDKEMNEEKQMIQNLLIDSTSPKASLPAQEEEAAGPLVPFGFQYYPGVEESNMYSKETQSPSGSYRYMENLNTEEQVGGLRGHPPYKLTKRPRTRQKHRLSDKRLFTRSGPWTHKKSKTSSKKRHSSTQSWFFRRVFGPVQMILPPFYPQPCPWLLSKRCFSCCKNEKSEKENTKVKEKAKEKDKDKEKDKEKEKDKDTKFKDDVKTSGSQTTPVPNSMSEWEYLGRVLCSCPCCMECVVW